MWNFYKSISLINISELKKRFKAQADDRWRNEGPKDATGDMANQDDKAKTDTSIG